MEELRIELFDPIYAAKQKGLIAEKEQRALQASREAKAAVEQALQPIEPVREDNLPLVSANAAGDDAVLPIPSNEVVSQELKASTG